jgi:hypothetical protein
MAQLDEKAAVRHSSFDGEKADSPVQYDATSYEKEGEHDTLHRGLK